MNMLGILGIKINRKHTEKKPLNLKPVKMAIPIVTIMGIVMIAVWIAGHLPGIIKSVFG